MLKIAPTAHITVFADDILLQWMFDDVAAFNLIPTEVAGIFRTLRMYCLKVSTAKTGVLHSWWGSRMSATAKPHVAKIQAKRFFVVRLDGDTLYLPMVASHKHLGIILSYKNCEMLSLRYRLRQAWIAFNRLSCALKSRKLPVELRLRLYHAVCIACATYGLSSIGLSSEGRTQHHATIMRQLRMVIGDHSFLTGRTHAEILEMYRIEDPLLHVDSLLLRRAQLAQNNSYTPHHEALVQHWAQLTFSLSTPEPSQPKMAHRRQEFQDLAAYRFNRFHHTKVHLQRTREEQKDYRQQMIYRDSNYMHYAIGGLPRCRHCGRKFSAWTNFMSHFNRQCCPVLHLGEEQPAHLRDLPPDPIPLLQDPDAHSAAQRLPLDHFAEWIASKQHAHHCPVRNLWLTKPRWMRVHLQQQHTEYKAHLPTIDKRLKALGSSARQCEWCDTRHDRGRAACTIYLTAALIQQATAHTPDPSNDTSQAGRAPKGTTGDESVDGNDGLPRAEGTHGDQRHGQKGQGSRSGAGHRQETDKEPKTRERSRQAKPKTGGQRQLQQPTGRSQESPRSKSYIAYIQNLHFIQVIMKSKSMHYAIRAHSFLSHCRKQDVR